ncbi:putative TIR-NBS-LRR resistance protein [Trifolium pratense]|uniref:Putative TIR-NBS-LRR resistance protein n=1 Tax=Trifolium pratense TaxID=57577 RepID=A0A2K3JV15_TRIPR|nr:putative TIR-NBS-LRR resistance protein [Trifolium pratense]
MNIPCIAVLLKVIPSIVMRRFRGMKAIVVLDGLNSSKLLENLIGVRRGWLRGGSTVIVTTRNKDGLISGGVDEIYEVQKMNLP